MNAVASWREFVYHVIFKSIIKREQIVQVLFKILFCSEQKNSQISMHQASSNNNVKSTNSPTLKIQKN